MPIALVLALLLSSLTACEKKASPEPEKSAPGAMSDAGTVHIVDGGQLDKSTLARDAGPPVHFSGKLRGVVKLAKGQKLPLAPFPQLSGATPPSVAPCPPVDAADQRLVTLAKQTGGLSPVHVAITGMTAAPPHQQTTHDLFIDACRVRPGLIAAVRGDLVRITNRSETALVPRMPGASFMRGLLRGESQQGELKQARTTVDCTFGSWCGETLVIATTHSLAAVTTPEGFFTIDNVPLDQPLKVHAWNPLFQLHSESFTLSAAEPEKMVELTLTPTAAAASTVSGPPKSAAKPKLPAGKAKAPARGPDDL